MIKQMRSVYVAKRVKDFLWSVKMLKKLYECDT